MLPYLALFLAFHGGPPAVARPVKVVTSLTTYAAIAREIVGDRGTVTSIANGDENPHYVQPKPSFVPTLSQADLFVTTGLDLVLWVPALLDQGKLLDFLKSKQYQGAPLVNRLGGWLKDAMPFRGKQVACYHKEWDYFSREYGLPCIDYIEPKPGIPPTPGHVLEVINEMREHHIQVLLSTNYYDHNQVLEVAQKTGAKAVIVPSNTNGAPGINTYFDLINLWITELARAFGGGGPAAN